MSKLILCTVGTSVFDLSKYRHPEVSQEFEGLCKEVENNNGLETSRITAGCQIQDLNRVVDLFVRRVRENETRTACFPAEIASLMNMMILKDTNGNVKYGSLGDDDKVVLLFSDSPEGGLAALLNGAIISKALFNIDASLDTLEAICTPNADPPATDLEPRQYTYHLTHNVDLVRIVGLRIQESSTVVAGLKNLVAIINQMGTDYDGWEKLFNFTAGFKGVVPFAFVSAIRKGFTAFFLHENGREAIYFNPLNQFVNTRHVRQIIESSTVSGRDGSMVAQQPCAGTTQPEDMVGA